MYVLDDCDLLGGEELTMEEHCGKDLRMSEIRRVAKFLSRITMCATCCAFIFVANPASAWYASIHDAMTRSMIEGLPPNVRGNLNMNAVLFGANEPDGTMYDPEKARRSNSYGYETLDQNWQAAASKTGISQSDLMNWRSPKCYHGNLDCINQLRTNLVNELASPSKNWNKISVQLGQLSHHVQDLHQPYHAAEVSGRSVKPGAHEEFEKKTGDIFRGSQIELSRSTSAASTIDPNDIAQRVAPLVNEETRLLNGDSLKQYLEWSVANSEAYVNQALSEGLRKESEGKAGPEPGKLGDAIRKLRDESKGKIKELKEQINKAAHDAIDQHRRDHPDLHGPSQPPDSRLQDRRDSSDCPFRWTHPLCNWTYCCPYNNGWDKDCLRAGKCWPAVEGCMKGFGCRRVE